MDNAKLLHAIIETAIDGIITIDRYGCVESINPAACRVFGYRDVEVIGNNVNMLMPEPDHSRHDSYLKYHQNTGENRIIGKGREVKGLRKDGTTFPFRLAVNEVQYENSIIYTGFIHDLSKEREAEEHLRQYTADLEGIVDERTDVLKQLVNALNEAKDDVSKSLEREKELHQMKSRFVSMASHEFRTPLSSVQLSTILIEKYLQISDHAQILKHLRMIQNAVASLNTILNDFLSLDRLEAGAVNIDIKCFDIIQFAEELTEELQMITKSNQHIIYQHTGQESMVYLDANLLKNCLINLISNAIKYSGEDTFIEFSTEITDDRYVLIVKDNGMGIPMEDQKGLFQPFFRANNTGQIPGTGLGLNIVKRYVDLMGGEIFFESRENEGAQFALSFQRRGD